jgi:hypothetical protein
LSRLVFLFWWSTLEGIYKSGMRNLSLAGHWFTDFVIFTSFFRD